METRKFASVLAVGENIATEFKRCGGKPEADTYETICSFLNRFGGDLFLGVTDDGIVLGVPDRAAQDIVKNIIKTVSNSEAFTPTVYLAPEVMEYESKTVVYVHVPPSSEVHSFKKVIYDRIDDADVRVTATSQIAAMYIRKQSILTEKKVYPYVKDEDLRFDLLPRVRQMAVNRHLGHSLENMSDIELLQSAGLVGEDKETGAKGYNLAGSIV
jgi:ATP-dependent DNA helicase RecG